MRYGEFRMLQKRAGLGEIIAKAMKAAGKAIGKAVKKPAGKAAANAAGNAAGNATASGKVVLGKGIPKGSYADFAQFLLKCDPLQQGLILKKLSKYDPAMARQLGEYLKATGNYNALWHLDGMYKKLIDPKARITPEYLSGLDMTATPLKGIKDNGAALGRRYGKDHFIYLNNWIDQAYKSRMIPIQLDPSVANGSSIFALPGDPLWKQYPTDSAYQTFLKTNLANMPKYLLAGGVSSGALGAVNYGLDVFNEGVRQRQESNPQAELQKEQCKKFNETVNKDLEVTREQINDMDSDSTYVPLGND